MSSLAELLPMAPSPTDGELIGDRVFADERFVVQMAVPVTVPEAARWGSSTWGTAEWSTGAGVWGLSRWGEAAWSSGFEWLDLSDRVRGCTWQRGATTLTGRPDVGTATIELGNADGYLSPANAASTFPSRRYLAPGTLVRLGWLGTFPGWMPAFTGELEAIDEDAGELDGDPRVTFTLHETLGRLATVDRPETIPHVAAQQADVRFAALLVDAGFPYGSTVAIVGAIPAVAAGYGTVADTGMAGNRLGELYQTGDSVGVDVITARNGNLLAIPKDPAALPFGTLPTAGVLYLSEEAAGTPGFPTAMPWASAPVVHTNTDDLINRWGIARAGGSVAVAVDDASVAVNGEQGSQRTDLIHTNEPWSALYAAYLVAVTGPTIRARKLDGLTVDADMHDYMHAALIAQLDVNVGLNLYRSSPRWPALANVVWSCAVRGYTVSVVAVTPGYAKVTATLAVTVLTESTV